MFFRADFMGLMETDAVIGYKISLALARLMSQRLRDWMTGSAPVEVIVDAAEQKGTGRWTVQSALELGVPVSTIA